MKRLILASLLAISFPLTVCATQLKPWFGNVFEFEARATYFAQNFENMDTGLGPQYYNSNDNFGALSLATNIWGNWNVELEVVAGETRAHSFNFDSALLTGRFLVLDDVIGDPVSLTVGITAIQTNRISLYDPARFHHGFLGAEFHAAVGRETVCGARWNRRWWVVGAVGTADIGSPWMRGDAFYEFQLKCQSSLELGVRTLWGFGDDNILLLEDFAGYGPIAHRSVDLGVAYIYRFDIWGSLRLEYRHRVYAHNFPEQVNFFLVEYLYPFGL